MSTNTPSPFARSLATSALLTVAASSSAQFSLNVVAFPIAPAYSGSNSSIAIAAGAVPTSSTARTVNSLGQIAGNATYTVGAPQGVYTGAVGTGPVSVASSAPSGSASFGFTALSSNGFGAGTSSFGVPPSANKLQAFRYSGGTITPLGTFGFNDTSTGAGVNASGTVVGDSINPAGNDRGFYAKVGGGLVDIGTLPGTTGTDSAAYAINDAGTIVGAATTSGASTNRAIVYQGGTMNMLALPSSVAAGNVLSMSAIALSATGGFIAGNFLNSSGFVNTGFLSTGATATSAGTTTALPLLFAGKSMTVTGVNSLGWVVGFTTTSTNANTGFVYANGTLTNLSTLLPAGYSFGAGSITGITDNGYISATLVGPGSTGAFATLLQLSPVPEPTTLAALGLGTIAFLRRRRKA